MPCLEVQQTQDEIFNSLNFQKMKKLEMSQMENIEGGSWESLLCRAAFGIAGALIAGPAGAMILGTIGNIICYPATAS